MSIESNKLIQMRLRPETIRKVEELQEWFGVTNKTAAVRASIDLAHMLIEGVHSGTPDAKLYFEDKHVQHQVAIPGITSLKVG